jgi:GAF domain-containing protein
VHVDPAKEELLREMRRRFPPRDDSPNPGTRALRSGQLVFAPEIPTGAIEAVAPDPEHRAMLRQLGVRSCIGVPIVARGRAIGAITLIVTEDSGRCYGAGDVELAEDLARRAAVAIDNARLYAEAQRASARLRALSWAATEAQTAPDEGGVFEVIDAAIVRSGLNVHASLLERDAGGAPTLVIQHVALVDELRPLIERLLGRPIVGIRIEAGRVEAFREAIEGGRVVSVANAAAWLREALPWLSERAGQVIGRLRQVGQGMAVPITDGREVLGMLSIWGESLGEADLAAMELLGRQAGGALAALRHRADERERDRLDGAMLLARTAAHAVNNALGLTSGYAELLAGHPKVESDPELAGYAREIIKGTEQAAERVARFQKVTRIEETPSPLGEGRPLLDMDRSVAPGVG